MAAAGRLELGPLFAKPSSELAVLHILPSSNRWTKYATYMLCFQAGRGKWLVVTTVEEIKPACCFTPTIWAGALDAKKAAHLEMRGFSLE